MLHNRHHVQAVLTSDALKESMELKTPEGPVSKDMGVYSPYSQKSISAKPSYSTLYL